MTGTLISTTMITVVILMSMSSAVSVAGRRKYHKHHQNHENDEDYINNQVQKVPAIKVEPPELFGISDKSPTFNNYDKIVTNIAERMKSREKSRGCDEALEVEETKYKELFEEVYKLFYNIRSVTTDINSQPSTSRVRRAQIDNRSHDDLVVNAEANREALRQLKFECRIINSYLEAKDKFSSSSSNTWVQTADITSKLVHSDLITTLDSKLDLAATYSNLTKAITHMNTGTMLDPTSTSGNAEEQMERYSRRVALLHSTLYKLRDCAEHIVKLITDLGKIYNFNEKMDLAHKEIESFVKNDDSKDKSRCYEYILTNLTRLHTDLSDTITESPTEILYGAVHMVDHLFPEFSMLLLKRSLLAQSKTCDFSKELVNTKIELYNCTTIGGSWCSTNFADSDRNIVKWWSDKMEEVCPTAKL